MMGLVSLQAHGATVCVEVRFASALDDQQVVSLRNVPFKQIRQRLYILKQKFDDEHPQPSVPLMPLVETTNLATTMYVLQSVFQESISVLHHTPRLLCIALREILICSTCCVIGSLTKLIMVRLSLIHI